MKFANVFRRSRPHTEFANDIDDRVGADSASASEFFANVFATCGSTACPRRKRFFPSYRRKSHGFLVEDRWFCGPGCAHEFLLYRVRSLLSGFRFAAPRAYRVPLGMLLVNRGTIDRQRLQEALRLQKDVASKRLGEHLISLGAVTELQLAAALSQQWSCPYYPLEAQPVEFLPFSLAPLEVFRASRAVPAYISSDARSLHVAFCDRIDHTTLFALESMLGCRTFPSVATTSAVHFALDSQAASLRRQDPFFETVRDARDISAILASYALEVRAARLKLVRTQHHLWGRLQQKKFIRDVLFQLPPSYPPSGPQVYTAQKSSGSSASYT
jgi:hypothetical protein